ncbi:hypothetical protein BJY52DRAFT_358555 [Lactarius psammicola]|nr:hypothetical protein BJY52DRAFT_358555 [Lactarius psammicola]
MILALDQVAMVAIHIVVSHGVERGSEAAAGIGRWPLEIRRMGTATLLYKSPGLLVSRAAVCKDRRCYCGPSTYSMSGVFNSRSAVANDPDEQVRGLRAATIRYGSEKQCRRSVLGGQDDLGSADISVLGDLSCSATWPSEPATALRCCAWRCRLQV